MSTKLALSHPIPPGQVYAPAHLRGGTSPTTVVATWQAVTDGSFRITIDGTQRDITGLNFSADTTLALIAARIQTAIRTATGGSEVVKYDSTSTRFVIFSGNTTSISAITVTSAVGSGTDISGAGATAFLDSETGRGTAVAKVEKQINLTQDYQTIHEQFAIAHAGQLSVKMRHYPTASSQTMTMRVQVSDDDMDTAEASSEWHDVGSQDNGGGDPSTLSEESHEYAKASAGSSQENWVPYDFPTTAQKARVQAKCSVVLGRAAATVGLVPIV